jgi:hypothetical protein
MQSSREIKGFFLSFTEEETASIAEAFEEMEIPFTPEGIKLFLFQSLNDTFDEEEKREDSAADRVIKGISQFVKNNPEKIRAYGAIAGALLKKIRAGR